MKYKYLIAASISLFIVVFFLFDGCISKVGGNFESDFNTIALSAELQALIKTAYEGISGFDLRDYHTHIAGTGACKSGCFVNAKMTSLPPLTLLYIAKTVIPTKGRNLQFLTRIYVKKYTNIVVSGLSQSIVKIIAFSYSVFSRAIF